MLCPISAFGIDLVWIAASHQQCLIEHQSKDITEVLEALEYMEDFVETYDSALGLFASLCDREIS